MLARYLRRFYSHISSAAGNRNHRPRKSFCGAQLECLESRCLLSGVPVTLTNIRVAIDSVASPFEISEDGGSTTFKVYRVGGESTHVVTVPYTILGNGDTGEPGKDLSSKSGTVKIGLNETFTFIKVTARNDKVDEPNEEFRVVLGHTSAKGAGKSQIIYNTKEPTGRFVVQDDDEPPEVSISGRKLVWDEGNRVDTFKIVLKEASEQVVSVGYFLQAASFSKQANVGSDVAIQGGTDSSSGLVKFQRGQKQIVVRIQTFDDKIFEGSEGYFLYLGDLVNAKQDSNNSQLELTINDQDIVNVSLKAVAAPFDSTDVLEGDLGTPNSYRLELVFDAVVESDELLVSFKPVDGTAIAGEDYDYVSFSRMLYLQTSPVDIIHSVLPDLVVEPNEYFFMTLTSFNKNVRIVRDRVKINIMNDDK